MSESLSAEELGQIKAFVVGKTLPAASEALGVAQATLAKVVGGFAVSNGTVKSLRLRLQELGTGAAHG